MGQNQITESLVETMLSWMRWLTSWFWNIVNAQGTSGGFLRWFSDHWIAVAVLLIIGGAMADWLIWMVRWRPYWLWLRKRQIVYEEVKPPAAPPPRFTQPRPADTDEFDDPFAAAQEVDPYAAAREAAEISSWDISDDPYARQPERHTDYDPRLYGRPALGESRDKSFQNRMKPIFGERIKELDEREVEERAREDKGEDKNEEE